MMSGESGEQRVLAGSAFMKAQTPRLISLYHSSRSL